MKKRTGIVLLTAAVLAGAIMNACAEEAQALTSADEAPVDTVFEITGEEDVENIPGSSGKLMTAGLSDEMKYQMFISSEAEEPVMYCRFFSSDEWTEWTDVSEDGEEDKITLDASSLLSMADKLSEVYDAVISGFLEIAPSGVEQGTWSYCHKGDNEARLRSAVSYKIPYGTKVIFSNPSMRIAFGLLETPESDRYVQFSEWIEPGSVDAEYTF